MTKILEEMDKMGIKYTLNTNPTDEEIQRIKTLLEKKENLFKKQQQVYKDGRK